MSSLSNREILSVSDLTRSARMLLEGEFPSIFVEGEISNFSKPASGHWYFTLKDSKSQLRSAMFKGRNSRLRFLPKNGTQVIVRGKISLYEGRGDFQMIAEHMEEAGDGALRRAFEQLKASLESEGLFSHTHKQPLPALPQHLAVITSPTGAAIRDVLHVFKRRFPALNITVLPVPVQGDEAAPQIVKAIQTANTYSANPFDAILLTRGGGSLEDLWAFNTEPVARAIYTSDIPIVSAVGHEIDVSIADFVADLRAPTPSAAAELLSPDQSVWLEQLKYLEQKVIRLTDQKQQSALNQLGHMRARLRHPGERLNQLHQRFDDLDGRLQRVVQQSLKNSELPMLKQRLIQSIRQNKDALDQQVFRLSTRIVDPRQNLERKKSHLAQIETQLSRAMATKQQSQQLRFERLTSKLSALSPLKTLERGYSIVATGDTVVTDSTQVKAGDTITARLKTGALTATVTDTNK